MKGIICVIFTILLLSACDSKPSQREIESAANKGDSSAQYELYRLYSTGKATEGKNDDVAIMWLEKSAEENNSNAQYMLGTIYNIGSQGVIKNSQKSAYWLERSVKSGNESALFLTAMNYWRGWGVSKDPVKAYAYLLVAQSFGNEYAKKQDVEFRFGISQEQREEAEEMAIEIKKKHFNK